MAFEDLTPLQQRLARWQERHGIARVVVATTVFSVVASAIVCYPVFFLSYGDVTAPGPVGTLMPVVVPMIVSPLATIQFARILGAATRLVAELDQTSRELEAEVARRSEAQAELEVLTRHDPLTGALNRRGFYEAIALLEPAIDTHVLLTVIDVDHFKAVNDRFGHAAGDQVLVEVVRRAAPISRDGIIARMGGDEFVVAVDGVHEVERLRGALSTVTLPDTDVSVRCSIGAAVHQRRRSVDATLAEADEGLYLDKRAADVDGRPRLVRSGART